MFTPSADEVEAAFAGLDPPETSKRYPLGYSPEMKERVSLQSRPRKINQGIRLVSRERRTPLLGDRHLDGDPK
ncbi:hypothetical protein ACQZV8_10970 [Magnetococcales bacterium HHB-1]